jgi:tetratricopeptide (TPR) repeat protein
MSAWRKGDRVVTAFGNGTVDAAPRLDDAIVTVQLEWNAKAHLPVQQVSANKRLHEMSDAEKLARAHMHKAEGNVFFKLQDYMDALAKYEVARVYVRHLAAALSPRDAQELLLPIMSNSALAHLRLKNYPEAIQACDEALKLAGPTAKVLFLRGQARRVRCDYDLAIADFVAAAKLAPGNAQIRAELHEARSAAKRAREREADMFRGTLAHAPSSVRGAAPPEPPPQRGFRRPVLSPTRLQLQQLPRATAAQSQACWRAPRRFGC